jgi:hypothetical protein
MAALRAELAGGLRTGFRPASTGTGITVTFARTIMASTREPKWRPENVLIPPPLKFTSNPGAGPTSGVTV